MTKVLLTAHYNLNNGDRAVFEASLEVLKNKYKNDLDLTVSAFSPKKMIDRVYKVVPWGIYSTDQKQRRMIKILAVTGSMKLMLRYAVAVANKDYLEAVNRADIIFVSGGHHLTDILGDDIFYSLALNIAIPIALKKRVILLPQTFGGFKNDNALKTSILRYIVNKSAYVAYRDSASEVFLKEHKCFGRNCVQVSDIVYGYPCQKKTTGKERLNRRIGIALYGNYSGEGAKEKILGIADELIGAVKKLAQEGYSFQIIPMEIKNSNADDRWIANYIIKMANVTCISVFDGNDSIESIIEEFGNNDIIIAYKTHSVVFSMIEKIPLVAVAYHKKSIDFMYRAGLLEYSLIDNEATTENLYSKIKLVEKNYSSIVKKETGAVQEAKCQIKHFVAQV